MSNILNLGKDLYIKGRIGWKGLKKEEYLDSGDFKIINATALEDGYIDWDNCGFITKERYEESPEIMLQEDDILISKDGTLGKIGYVKNMKTPCSVASGIFVLRNSSKEKVNFDYLYHLLTSHIFKDFIKRNKAEGSTINHLYQRDLENFEINLPDLEIQEKVAFVLNSIDRKIQNNNKQIQTLESLAKTIYDYWFVQFDFPNEDGKPYKSSGGKMVWNEELKREIPEGWKVDNLISISEFINGLACQNYRPTKNEKGINVVKIKEMRDGVTENTELVSENIPSKYLVDNGDLLFSWSASLLVDYWYHGVGGLNQHIFKVVPKEGISKEYVFHQLSDYILKFIKIAESRKTTMGHITSDHLKQSIIYVAPRALIDSYSQKSQPIRSMIQKLSLENDHLSSLKKFILPLLMNGQVHV